ncbi:MAG: ATP-binding protein [Chloroflexota bacterium]
MKDSVKFRDSIAIRYFVAIFSVLIVGQLVFSVIVLYTNFTQQRDDLYARAEAHVNFLSEVMPDNILANNFYPLETLMQQTAAEADFVYSVATHVDGRLITNYLNGTDPLIQEAVAEASEPNTLARIAYIADQPNIIEVQSSIIADDVLLGDVRLGYSTDNLNVRLRNNIITTLLWSSLLSLALAVVTIVLFNLQIRTPLRNLGILTTQFANGNLEMRSPAKGNTEISQLQHAFNEMAEQIQENIKEMTKLTQVASRTKNAVIIADPRGYVEWVNQAFEDITGYTLEDVQGKTPGSLLQGENTDPATVAYMRDHLRRGQGFNVEVINYHKSGEEYWIAVEVRPVHNDAGELTNFIAIETDITERKASQQALRQSRDELAAYAKELERSNRELQDFAYVSSHDLQEPLRKIQAFGSRIESRYGDVLDERGIDYIQRVQNAASRMQILINDLLEFSRVTTKAKAFREVNLNQTLNGVLSDLEIRMKETKAKVHADTLPTIDAEPHHMRQLMQNIISNAIKFHHPDRSPEVTIRSEIIEGEKRRDYVKIEISDNGIGFNQRYADKIFTVFQRLHAKNEYEGTGIGLAVCRRIVEHHNGEIIVSSTEGVGTTFTITLPVTQVIKRATT